MLKILQARLQQYVSQELPDVQAGLRKRQRNQRSNYQHLLEHQKSKRIPEKHLLVSLIMLKPLTVWITINWKILKDMGISDYLTCLLRNLYTGQEATIRTGHGTTD